MDKRGFKGASIKRGAHANIVDGSIFVTMMAKRVGFATVTPEIVSIRFRLAVRRMRGLCWASIVCGTMSF